MYNIGQTLWRVSTDTRSAGQGNSVVITKVGRKWLTVKEDVSYPYDTRVDIETLVEDGGEYTPRAQYYLSRDEYITEKVRDDAWRKFKTMIEYCYKTPSHISAQDIIEMYDIYNRNLPSKE